MTRRQSEVTILKMDLRYQIRRVSAALLAATMISAPLAVFFFPVTVVKNPYTGQRLAASTICYTGTEYISFRPVWQLDGLPADGVGLFLQILLVLSLGIGVWAMYPAFKPSPR